MKTIGKWKNLLIFGDNFQVLKTLYENKDELIKDKIKGKVKYHKAQQHDTTF